MGTTVSALVSSSTTMAKNAGSNGSPVETEGCKWHISAIDFSKCTNDSHHLAEWLEDPELYFFDEASDCCMFAFGTSSCPKEDACSAAASTNPTTVSAAATTLPHFETVDGCQYSLKWHISLDFTKCTNDLDYQRQWLENPDLYFFNEASDCCILAFNNPDCIQEHVCPTNEDLEVGSESAAGASCEGLGKKQCNKSSTCKFNVGSGSCDPIESAGSGVVAEGKEHVTATTTPNLEVVSESAVGTCEGLSKKQCNRAETCEFNVDSGSCDPIEPAHSGVVEGEKHAAATTAATTTVPNLICPSTIKKCKKSEHCYWTGTTCVPLQLDVDSRETGAENLPCSTWHATDVHGVCSNSDSFPPHLEVFTSFKKCCRAHYSRDVKCIREDTCTSAA